MSSINYLKSLKTISLTNTFSIIVLAAGLIVIAIVFYLNAQFIGISRIENPLDSTGYFNSVLLVGCENKTAGNETRYFIGETVFASTCEQPNNVCLVNICTENRTCAEKLVENATCSQDSNCDPHYKCDLDTCSCVRSPNCETVDDCPSVSNNNCAEFVCLSNNTCDLQTKSGMNCSTDQECGISGYFCSFDCQCVPDSSIQCTQNSECGTIENNVCAEMVCLSNNTCNQQTKAGMNCSDTNECGTGEICSNCQCTSIASVECVNNEDCGTIKNNNCAELVCLSNNTCSQQTKAGMNCSSFEECNTGEFCAPGCQCTSIASVQCVNNEDCGTLENNVCAEIVCLSNNTCNQQTKAGMNCSDTKECGAGEFCSDCQCTSIVSVQCVNDEDCGTIENNNCAELVCLGNNTCNQQTKAGMNCSDTQECGSGEVCGPSCQCVSTSSSSSNGWAYYSDNITGLPINFFTGTEFIPIQLVMKSGLDFSIVSSNNISFIENGDFLISYSIAWGADSSTSTSANLDIELDTGSGFARFENTLVKFLDSGSNSLNFGGREVGFTASIGDKIRFRIVILNGILRMVGDFNDSHSVVITIKKFT